LRPVRIVSPGLSVSSCFSEACCAPIAEIHTSPEDLLTDQMPSSAAIAPEPAKRTSIVARAPRIPLPKSMMYLSCSPSRRKD
jgi:hypothetical protein